MTVVRDLIVHILLHVDAEDAATDPSQIRGVGGRAMLVRESVQTLRADIRDLTLRDILQAVYDAIPDQVERDSLRRAVASMRATGSTRPQLAIQAWVGKKLEVRGG